MTNGDEGPRTMLLSEGRDISSEEADLLSAGLALREFVEAHAGRDLSTGETAVLAALLRQWACCLAALAETPRARRRFLVEAIRPATESDARRWFDMWAARAIRAFPHLGGGEAVS